MGGEGADERFPRNPGDHTCLGDLFKRAPLKRTRFTFMAIHSTGRKSVGPRAREGDGEKEEG